MPVPSRTNIYPIYSPARGLVMNAPGPFLDPRASPDAQNVRYYDSIVEKRTGYPSAAYDSGTITGVPLKLYTYTKGATDYEILATTTTLEQRSGTGHWTDIKTYGSALTNITMCTVHKAGVFYLVYGSKENAPRKWSGAGTDAAISGASTYKPKIMLPYQFRLLIFNYDDNGTDMPITFRYTVADDFEDFSGTGSNARNMPQGAGTQIMNAVAIKDYVGVYKDKSISVLDYVGGSSYFATAVHIEGIGLLATDAIVNLGTSHLFMGSDYNIYEWNGGWELIPIGNAIKKYIKDNIYKANKSYCFATANFERTEAHFFIPITNGYPTRFLTYNWTDKTWALNTCASCSGGGNLNTSGVEKTMIGLSAGAVHNYDYDSILSLNDGDTPINSYFTTPDVTVDKEEYKIKRKDFRNVYVDAKGDDLSMYYSINEGSTWSDVDTNTLKIVDEEGNASDYNLNSFNFAKSARNIRFKFANATTSESYAVRFVGIEHKDIKQSGRK